MRRKPLSGGRALAKEQLEVLYPGALPTRLELQSGAGAQQVRDRVRVRVRDRIGIAIHPRDL